MEDQDINRSSSNQTTAAGGGGEAEKTEPVRSRWTPKPEQILILESIFNSGMVNPPKDETVRIRKLLEKFGSVGDANVFYWFQNRRSRSRRRQRQIQAASLSTGGAGGGAHIEPPPPQTRSIPYEISNSPTSFSAVVNNNFVFSTTSTIIGSSSSSTIEMVQNEVFAFTPPICHPEFDQISSASSLFYPSEINNSDYQSEFVTVFINGVATEVPKGPFDMRAMCGQDFVLFHSSGVPIPVNEYGFVLETLQHGESYFLVPRQT